MCCVQIVFHELDLTRVSLLLHVHIDEITTFQALPGVDSTVFVFIHISVPFTILELCFSGIGWHS